MNRMVAFLFLLPGVLSAGEFSGMPLDAVFAVPLNGSLVHATKDHDALISSSDRQFLLDGKRGLCLLTGDDKTEVRYSFTPAFSLASGSFSCWFRWLEPDTVSTFTLAGFRIKNNGTLTPVLALYITPYSWFSFMALRYDVDNGKASTRLTAIKPYMDAWRNHPDEWHLVTFTWCETEGRLYLDGILIDSDPGFAKTPLTFDTLAIGASTVSYDNPEKKKEFTRKKYLIADVRLYDYVLDPSVICAEYQKICGDWRDKDDF